VGWAGGRWLERGVATGWINTLFERLSSLGRAFLAFGRVQLVGGNGFIAAVAYALLSLSVNRMLPIALALLGTALRTPSGVFLGWFGPHGLASILFAWVVVEEGACCRRDVARRGGVDRPGDCRAARCDGLSLGLALRRVHSTPRA
jgi:NhaP-type Na+/H+ or K+/H+ antiporter